MSIETISELAHRVRSEYETTDPWKMCDLLDIRVGHIPMGDSDGSLKALISRQSRCYSIILNSSLHQRTQKFLCWHELGHYFQKHLDTLKTSCMGDYTLVDESCRMEIEANMFVAEYLLGDEETLEALDHTGDFFKAACELYVPQQFLAYKMRFLRYYDMISAQCPIEVPSTFMGRIDCSGCGDDEYASCCEC